MDIDGTLVLSNDAHALAWVEALAHHGYTVEFSEVRRLIGMGGDKLIPQVAPGLDAHTEPGKKIGQFRSELFQRKYAAGLKPAPGSRELVQRLLDEGLQLMVASSAKESDLNSLLKAARVDDLLHHSTTSSDADASKPEPDIVGAALDKIGLSALQVLMLGDTPYDIEAAKQCGIGVVAVRCGGWSDAHLDGALAIYDDPADLLANFDSSPFISN